MLTVITLGLAIASGHNAPAAPWWRDGQGHQPIVTLPLSGHQPIVKIDGKDYPPTTGSISWGPGNKTVTVRLTAPPAAGAEHRVEMVGEGLFFTPQKFTLTAAAPQKSVTVQFLASCTTTLIVKAFDASGANPAAVGVFVSVVVPYGAGN